jgi:iron complex outermembrane receptor protein
MNLLLWVNAAPLVPAEMNCRLACEALGQDGSVTGQVLDPAGAIVPGAKVSLGSDTAAADAEGRYRFDNIGDGEYRLIVSAAGFAVHSETVHVDGGDVQRDVTLQIARLDERLVVSEKAPAAENMVDSWTDNIHASVGAREVRESGARDAGEALAAIDGLAKVRKAGIANDVLMRGLGRDNINVLVDGARLHGACPSGMDPRAFHVDFAEVERVEVTKGAFDLRNQGSLGGAVNIVTKEPASGLRITPGLMTGSFGFFNPSMTGSYAGERLWGTAGYSFRVSEPYRDGAGRPFTGLTNYRAGMESADAFRIHTGWFRMGGEPRSGARAKLSFTRQASGQTLYPYLTMDAGYDHADRLAASWEAGRTGSVQRIRVEGYASRVKHWMADDRRTSSAGAPLGFSMGSFAESGAYGGKVEIESEGLTAGAEAYRRKWDGVSTSRALGSYASQHFIPAPVSDVAGGYAEYQRTFGARLHVTAGARVDRAATAIHAGDAAMDLFWAYKQTRSRATSDLMPSGSVRAAYSAGPLELFAGAGSTARVPDPVERYVASARMGSDFVGDPNLRPTRNTETDAGLTWRAPWLLIRVTAFYSRLGDFVTVHNQARLTPGGAMANLVARSFANVDARSYGGELTYSIPVRRAVLVSGGLGFARIIKDAAPRLGIFDRDAAEVPPLRSHTTLRYGTRRLFVETTFTAVSAQRRVDRDLLETPTPGYGVLDFKAGVHGRKLNFAAGLGNVLNRFYYEHCSYQRDPFRSGVRVPEPGRNFFLTLQYGF